jgi:hypothetical protein
MRLTLLLRFVVVVMGCALGAAGAVAQSPPAQSLPPDVASLPNEIKTLPWQSIDLNAITPLEHARALLLMNHVLDEIASVRTSEADLMSAYIQQQNLGSELAKTPPPPVTKQLTFTDSEKIAVALLRGPMATSSYARQFSDNSGDGVAAYVQMYEGTCQRRWSELDEARQQVRCMAAFLQKKGKLKDYEAWANTESQKRQQQYEQSMAQKRTTEEKVQAQRSADERKAAEQQAQFDSENQQLRQALAFSQRQQQMQAAQIQQQQQQTQQQQQQQAANTQQPNYPVTQPEAPGLIPGAEMPDPYYGGYYGYYPPTYYSSESAWCHDAAYQAEARAQTDQRISGWHGAPVGRGRR